MILFQDSLNNNSNVSPQKSSWQDSLRNSTSQGNYCQPALLLHHSYVTYSTRYFKYNTCISLSRVLLCIAGCLSPNHSCLDDGSHVTTTCPAAPGITSSGTPSNPSGNHQSPGRPLLYDCEGNRRERPEYGKKTDAVVSGQSKSMKHP